MTTPDWLVPFAAIEAGVETDAQRAFVALRHGSMLALLYAPKGPDTQSPHRQDEIYIIQSGHGVFDKAGEKRAFGPGDVIFVEARAEHRFEDFSEDFAAWAVFWGPEGGEP
ncbi:MAG: cupin domain-containing protein [Caulobacterales bacterium]